MESLNRKPDLSSKGSFKLGEDTIEIINIKVRDIQRITNNKSLSDFDKGINIAAAKMLVNGKSIVADDLLDKFNEYELKKVFEFIEEVEGSEKND